MGKVQWWDAWLCGLLLIALLFPGPASAGTSSPNTGGVFTVNTSNDLNTQGDSFISLREAMNIANGSLKGPFSLAERSLLTGCTFDAGGNITSGCGAGSDTIQFDPSLSQVLLTSRPPMINKDGVTLNGTVSSGVVIINGQGQADYGINVSANNVTIHDISMINLTGFGAAIGLGNGSWIGLRAYHNYLGVTPTSQSCSDPSLTAYPYFTVFLLGGSGAAGLGNGTAIYLQQCNRLLTERGCCLQQCPVRVCRSKSQWRGFWQLDRRHPGWQEYWQ